MPFLNKYKNKRVLVTGHTGFKGSWLSEWLINLGAIVTGYALPATEDSLFNQLKLDTRLDHIVGDVRSLNSIILAIDKCKPDFIFHLAAQPLVRLSYSKPVDTFSINIMGTVNVLEAVRLCGYDCCVVVITTDKCYDNKEWVHSYREVDSIGGYDPYSASKGAAELVISSYRRSYFENAKAKVFLASGRAGNVIGGGDWSVDRIVPDCIRALKNEKPILVRNKISTRPWQHVLEPLSGYLWLGANLSISSPKSIKNYAHSEYCSAFNFGPAIESNRSVGELVDEILKVWPGNWIDVSNNNTLHEANLLNLSTDKAYHYLGWKPIWNFQQTIMQTINWYRQADDTVSDVQLLTIGQIQNYIYDATQQGLAWTCK